MRTVLTHAVKSVISVLTALVGASGSAYAGSPQIDQIAPIAGLTDGEVRRCGVRVEASVDGLSVIIELALERVDQNTDFVVQARAFDKAGGQSKPAVLQNIGVRDALWLKGSAVERGGTRALMASANDPRVTEFVRNLMITGSAVSAEIAGLGEKTFAIPGPLPHSVRAAYLNCAGDLYRPGE